MKPLEKSAEPIRLTTAAVIDGVYFAAGQTLPYEREEDLPPNLKGLVATGQEDFFHPREIDFYNNPRPDCGVVYQPTGSDSQWTRRQARQVASVALEQDWAAEQLEREHALPKETQQALEDIHSKDAALGKAELQFARDQVDAAYEAAAQAAEPPSLFVKRGGMWAKTQNAKLRPGETVFTKQPNGEMWAAGIIDAEGQPPPQEITP
jgi:hypothetical protein